MQSSSVICRMWLLKGTVLQTPEIHPLCDKVMQQFADEIWIFVNSKWGVIWLEQFDQFIHSPESASAWPINNVKPINLALQYLISFALILEAPFKLNIVASKYIRVKIRFIKNSFYAFKKWCKKILSEEFVIMVYSVCPVHKP